MSGSPISRPGTPTPTDPAVADTVRRWVEASEGEDPRTALAAVVAVVADASGIDVGFAVDGVDVAPSPRVLTVATEPALLGAVGPWLPGFVLESLTAPAERRARGVHHTPPAVADAIVAAALDAGAGPPDVVADPAVGGGAFLLAACEQMDGSRPARVARVTGCDVDPVAVAVTRAALELWAGGPQPGLALRAGSFLDPDPLPGRPDLVVGNPPFLSQLRGEAVRDDEARARLRSRWPDVGRYVDDAAAFLLVALEAVADDGVVALIQPTSFLSAADAEPVRRRLADRAALVALWVDGDRRFDAAVDTIAPVLRRRGQQGPVRRVVGGADRPVDPVALPPSASWAPLVADLHGVPRVEVPSLRTGASLGEVATLTAGFRDEYYGLRDAVHDDPDGPVRLVTSGLIDPLEPGWGTRVCRFDRRRWSHPAVVPERVDPAVRHWVAARLVPKLMVASQTKILEVVVDATGGCVPSTPVVSVEPDDDAPSLWHLAAALTGPVASAFVVEQATGSALSPDAVRVSAARLAEIPLPSPGAAWDDAAAAAEAMQASPSRPQLLDVGRLTLAAHGVADRDDLFEWWAARLPRQPG